MSNKRFEELRNEIEASEDIYMTYVNGGSESEPYQFQNWLPETLRDGSKTIEAIEQSMSEDEKQAWEERLLTIIRWNEESILEKEEEAREHQEEKWDNYY